jgi:1,4-dihydroxy-2-naphthoate octaprenyltransferase
MISHLGTLRRDALRSTGGRLRYAYISLGVIRLLFFDGLFFFFGLGDYYISRARAEPACGAPVAKNSTKNQKSKTDIFSVLLITFFGRFLVRGVQKHDFLK